MSHLVCLDCLGLVRPSLLQNVVLYWCSPDQFSFQIFSQARLLFRVLFRQFQVPSWIRDSKLPWAILLLFYLPAKFVLHPRTQRGCNCSVSGGWTVLYNMQICSADNYFSIYLRHIESSFQRRMSCKILISCQTRLGRILERHSSSCHGQPRT